MKKILLIHHWSSIGGSGISMYNTWESLRSKYNVIAYIPDSPPHLLDFLQSKGLNPKTYSFMCGQIPYYSGGSNVFKPGFWYLLKNAISQLSYWKNIISEEQPDLIIVNSKVLCWMGKLFKKYKSVCFVRETIKGNPHNFINKIMKNMLEDFTLVSFLSEYDLLQTSLNKAKSLVAPDFLYPENYVDKLGKEFACKQINVEQSSFNVGFVGGIDKLKGIDIAIQAMELLKNENINLLVAGNDIGAITADSGRNFLKKIINRKSIKFSNKIKLYISQKGIESKIKFVGVQNDISVLYSASDVLVFPMKKPHQARPAFEIGVQKKPVIISDFPNIREFVREGENGLTFEPNNPEELAKAILKLKNNRQLSKKMGSSNFEYTMKYHTEEYAMGRLIDKIDEII
ncbi:glycosyltransferase family 4 protein [Neobacillus sp. M.A.Huq-85]